MKNIILLAIILIAGTTNAQIFFDDFNAEVVDSIIFANWDSIDEDGDGNFWEVFDSAVVGDGVSSLFTGFGADSDSWEGAPFTPDNFLITKDPLDLTNASGTTITYLVGTYQTNGTFIDDKYSIYLTEFPRVADIIAATPVVTKLVSDDVTASAGDGSDSAAQVVVDASAYDGMVVYLTFRHYDSVDINSVLLDDISVDATLGVRDESFHDFTYYVDINNQLVLHANVPLDDLQLFNIIGQEVIYQNLVNTTETIDLSSLQTGVYIAKISIDGATRSVRILKK